MPIEIKELHIKINVDEGNKNKQASTTKSKKERATIVADCVEQVMEILKMRNER